MEFPILRKIDGWYYLFFCIYDDDRINGVYDYRTFVYASRTLEELNHAPCIAQLNAHAPDPHEPNPLPPKTPNSGSSGAFCRFRGPDRRKSPRFLHIYTFFRKVMMLFPGKAAFATHFSPSFFGRAVGRMHIS